MGVFSPKGSAAGARAERSARVRRVGVVVWLIAWASAAQTAMAAVDLVWHTGAADWSFSVGQTVDLRLYAVSDNDMDEAISGLDVVITWDPKVLRLERDLDDGPYNWLMSGFFDDSQLDGLNDSLADGDAWYQAVARFSPTAVSTPQGLHVTTFRFTAVGKAEASTLAIPAALGTRTLTKVYQAGAINVDIKGELGTAEFAVQGETSLRTFEVSLPAGRTAPALVSGVIDDRETFGVTILIELVPREGATGSVQFTPSPPVDVTQAGDPWPGAGTFTPFDTDKVGFSATLNGSVDDDGTFTASPVTYSGPLTSFPMVASGDAAGAWDLVLATSVGDSNWEGLDPVLTPGVVRIVEVMDGDGDESIDLRDSAEFFACFTGPAGDGNGPIYSLAPQDRCVAYDGDNDGDVDMDDYALFDAVATGPGG